MMRLLVMALLATAALALRRSALLPCRAAGCAVRSARLLALEIEPPIDTSLCGRLLAKVRDSPGDVTFKETIAAIEEEYEVLEVPFTVGDVVSQAGQNMGSAKILSLGKIGRLSEAETLALFGEIYRGVLDTPEGEDHPNIRALMAGGWDCVSFPEGLALDELFCDLDHPENCS